MRFSTNAPAEVYHESQHLPERKSNQWKNLDSIASGGRTLLAVGVRAVWEQILQELVPTARHEIQQVLDQGILVLISHSSNIVHHVSGVVFDQELRSSGFKVSVRGKHGASLDKTAVSGGWICVCSRTSVVQRSEDTRRSFLFNEIADDFVIEILDGCPFDFFTHVLFLFRFECKFDEDLLQFFVDVIDAELFERVVLYSQMSANLCIFMLCRTSKISKPNMS